MNWTPVLPHVRLFRDSCNVYAAEGPAGMLIVDAGTGAWLDHLHELPTAPVALALTHYFRDHAAGAAKAAKAGIAIYAPEYERDIIADPLEHFRRRETYIVYDNLWDLPVLISPAPVAGSLRDYDRLQLAGLEIEVVPLPGVTLGQSGLALRVDGTLVVFCGETIHSPGRVARVAPFQYNYNDLGGAANCYASAQRLRAMKPDVLAELRHPAMLVLRGTPHLEANSRAVGAGFVRRPARHGLALRLSCRREQLLQVTDTCERFISHVRAFTGSS